MSLSEFRYSKRRHHYVYIFKAVGAFRKCIVFSTKPTRKHHGKIKDNIRLSKHPNKRSRKVVYVIPRICTDSCDSFDSKRLKWSFDKNDKRIIKRIKKRKKCK